MKATRLLLALALSSSALAQSDVDPIVEDKIRHIKEQQEQLKKRLDETTKPEDFSFAQRVEQSKRIAIARYPECAQPRSAFSRKMLEIADRLEREGNDLVYRSDSPERIADMAAGALGISPRQ